MKKQPTTRLTDGEPGMESSVVREISTVPGLGETITVRAAKAHLSGLLDRVAHGHKVIITSGGKPKARLVPIEEKKPRKVFTGTWEHLAKMPKWSGGPTADELVREDRDSRGW